MTCCSPTVCLCSGGGFCAKIIWILRSLRTRTLLVLLSTAARQHHLLWGNSDRITISSAAGETKGPTWLWFSCSGCWDSIAVLPKAAWLLGVQWGHDFSKLYGTPVEIPSRNQWEQTQKSAQSLFLDSPWTCPQHHRSFENKSETELWLEKVVHEPVWQSSPVWK